MALAPSIAPLLLRLYTDRGLRYVNLGGDSYLPGIQPSRVCQPVAFEVLEAEEDAAYDLDPKRKA